MAAPLQIDRTTARRLAVSRQHLDGTRLEGDGEGLRTVFRALRCVQIDPINVVAPSHALVLWSRLGPGVLDHLDELLWRQRWLFEYWAHGASIVLTEDYPIHRLAMDRFPPVGSAYGDRAAAWLQGNDKLRQHVLDRLAEAGPLPTNAFDDVSTVAWESSGWTAGRNVERMVEFLWFSGEVMVGRRDGRRRLWDLADRCLPPGTDRVAGERSEMITLAAEHSLRALGVAREKDVKRYFVRNRYGGLRQLLRRMEEDGRVVPAQVEGGPASERWYVHADVVDQVRAVAAGDWEPRTALLSPFDNLIVDRERTERVWGFAFRNEMYVPKQKRQYGYYLLPILHGDQLVGRVSPRVDRDRGVLVCEGLYLEPHVRPTAALRLAVTRELEALAAFAGAGEVEYGEQLPEAWRDLRTPA